MAIKNVIIEIQRRSDLEASIFGMGLSNEADVSAATAAVASIPGLKLDLTFAPVVLPRLVPGGGTAADAEERSSEPLSAESFASTATLPDFNGQTELLRGVVDESQLDPSMFAAGPQDGVVGIFADPVIEPAITCGGSAAVGNAADVARLLGTRRLRQAQMDGRNTLVAIVDTGVNIPYLQSRLGRRLRFSGERSWVPPLQPGQPAMTPGQMPVGHGTMCAFDALIAAPAATLLDIAVLASRRPGGSVMDGLLSDAVLGYSHLLRLIRGLGRPGDFHSLIVNNSWGMFQESWDFPPGHPGNYSDNPAHPFNRIVATLERAGADILFAAGNCGRECPDRRCGSEPDSGIFGANSHPAVLCVAGVDVTKRRVGYSTRGPGRIDPQKPDVAGFTHFAGSGVYPADGGTSAATPVVAGLVAAFRSRFPTGPDRTPAMLRDLVRRTADDVGEPGFDTENGFGIVCGHRMARSTMANAADDSRDGEEPPADDAADERGDVMPIENAEEFLRALRDYGFGDVARASLTATEGAPCADCGPTGGILPATNMETGTMADNDLEFIQALQQFGFQGGGAAAGMGGIGDSDLMDIDLGDGDIGGDIADDEEFMRALAAFGGPGVPMGRFDAGVDVTAAPSLADLCRVWNSVRRIVMRILPFLGAIPSVGPAMATAIRTLAALLDAVCRGGSAQNLCRRWRGGLRTVVARVASVVSRIPFIGGAAARGIRALIAAIDVVCRGV